jgi:tRNA-2-methylthio-N6-dimethylallyladenosine synthase
MNVADSDEMGRHLKARGLEQTFNADEASIVLVNTCTVREHAEHRAFSEVGRLRKWKQQEPGRKLVVTGCAAERTKEYIENRFPYVDLIVGAKSIEDFGEAVTGLLERRHTDEDLDYAAPAVNDNISAFVTIMRGCNYSCTYCIVPYVRGRESYHPIEQVIGEVRDRVAEGAREITLLGQTVNSYHRNVAKGRDTDFADLMEEVARVDGVDRIRFMSPHPYYMTDRVISAMAEVPAVCESLHLPVQSGSTAILQKMRRNYSREHYLGLVEKMRRMMPGMTLSTDIIVGFPGERDEDFRQTLSLLEEVRFDWGFIFKYSPREGTPAAELESLPEELVVERHLECLEVLDRISGQNRARLTGTVHEVLVEESHFGRTRTNYKVRVDGQTEPGEFVRVRITGAQHATLEGVIEDVERSRSSTLEMCR